VKPHSDDGQRRWLIRSPDGERIVARLTHPASLTPMNNADVVTVAQWRFIGAAADADLACCPAAR
jgi:hypothetical protein